MVAKILFSAGIVLAVSSAQAADIHFSCKQLHCESVDAVNDAPSGACMRMRFHRFTVRDGQKSGTMSSSKDGISWSQDMEAKANFATNPSTGLFLESTNRDVPVYAFLPYEYDDRNGGFRPSKIRTGLILYRPWSFGTAFTKAIFQCEDDAK